LVLLTNLSRFLHSSLLYPASGNHYFTINLYESNFFRLQIDHVCFSFCAYFTYCLPVPFMLQMTTSSFFGLGFVLFWWDWGLNLKQILCCLSYTPVLFALVIFGDQVTQTICPGWPPTSVILPMSASQVVRITGVSH
jgi:hypothetical protein